MPTKARYHKRSRAERGTLGSHIPVSRYSPIEKGRKDSLFLNCPFSKKCSGLKVSGVAHSAGSLCSAVRLVATRGPWRRQGTNARHDTHHRCVPRGSGPPSSHIRADWTSSASPTLYLLSSTPRTLLFAMGQLTMMDWNCLLGIYQRNVATLSAEWEGVCISERIMWQWAGSSGPKSTQLLSEAVNMAASPIWKMSHSPVSPILPSIILHIPEKA